MAKWKNKKQKELYWIKNKQNFSDDLLRNKKRTAGKRFSISVSQLVAIQFLKPINRHYAKKKCTSVELLLKQAITTSHLLTLETGQKRTDRRNVCAVQITVYAIQDFRKTVTYQLLNAFASAISVWRSCDLFVTTTYNCIIPAVRTIIWPFKGCTGGGGTNPQGTEKKDAFFPRLVPASSFPHFSIPACLPSRQSRPHPLLMGDNEG